MKTKAIASANVKSDKVDARVLAQLEQTVAHRAGQIGECELHLGPEARVRSIDSAGVLLIVG